MQQCLIHAVPVSEITHSGDNLLHIAKKACAENGLGKYDFEIKNGVVAVKKDTVRDYIHTTCSNSAKNMIKGWMEFDGHECSCHIRALSVVNCFVKKLPVFKTLRGMTTHFN